MGRTFARQAFAAAVVCAVLSVAFPPHSSRGGDLPHPAAGDPVRELASWLDDLCGVVTCDPERSSAPEGISEADWLAFCFVVDLESNGARADLTPQERAGAQSAALGLRRLLEEKRLDLDPAIGAYLDSSLESLMLQLTD